MDNLVWALLDVIRTEAEEEAARAGYDGGSWGYHGERYIIAREDAAEKFSKELAAVIDERVKAALAAK